MYNADAHGTCAHTHYIYVCVCIRADHSSPARHAAAMCLHMCILCIHALWICLYMYMYNCMARLYIYNMLLCRHWLLQRADTNHGVGYKSRQRLQITVIPLQITATATNHGKAVTNHGSDRHKITAKMAIVSSSRLSSRLVFAFGAGSLRFGGAKYKSRHSTPNHASGHAKSRHRLWQVCVDFFCLGFIFLVLCPFPSLRSPVPSLHSPVPSLRSPIPCSVSPLPSSLPSRVPFTSQIFPPLLCPLCPRPHVHKANSMHALILSNVCIAPMHMAFGWSTTFSQLNPAPLQCEGRHIYRSPAASTHA